MASSRAKPGELPLNAVLELSGIVQKGAEARRFERYYFRTLATATIQPPPLLGGEVQECFVLTRDLSRGGLSFLHPKRLALGQRVDLAFDDGCRFTVSVRWIQKLEERKFVIGCGFVKVGDGSQGPIASFEGEPAPELSDAESRDGIV
jgi:hypothetical protein